MSLEQYYLDLAHYMQQAGHDWVKYALVKKWKINAVGELLA